MKPIHIVLLCSIPLLLASEARCQELIEVVDGDGNIEVVLSIEGLDDPDPANWDMLEIVEDGTELWVRFIGTEEGGAGSPRARSTASRSRSSPVATPSRQPTSIFP